VNVVDGLENVVIVSRHAPQTTTSIIASSSRSPSSSANGLRRTLRQPRLFYTETMVRPCFLVIDREYSASISTRKLVIETAKFNVVTAYSAAEAVETLSAFPKINGVVLDAGIRDMTCCDLVARIKEFDAKLPVVVISSPGTHECPQADHLLESFEPARLLALLQSLDPSATEAIEKRNEQLNQILP
jgi:DNA-binding NtrC family response regulator